MKKMASTLPFVAAVSLCLSLTMLLVGCMSVAKPRFDIDATTYQAQAQDERIKFIVLHYTAEDDANSIRLLTTANVSAHYVIPQSATPKIYQLVNEDKRAWHAGRGGFAGRTALNDSAIGIEIVNPGIQPQYRHKPHAVNLETLNNNGYHPYAHYADFSELQIQKTAHLLQYLTAKYAIEPTHIIGHSDMAPSRKIDPGAKFPWQRLYREYGIGAWYDDADKLYFMNESDYNSHTIADIKQAFRDYGYMMNTTDEWDRPSQNVIYAFQLHFRPQQPTGVMDLETYAILRALIKKYGIS